MRIVTKKKLARRTVLRGLGASVALPLLDSMVPALSAQRATAANPVPRLGCIYVPNGIIHDQWVPTKQGTLELTPSLSPLEPVKDRVVVVTGLAHLEANSKNDGNADHPRATAVWLSGVHAYSSVDGSKGQVQLGTTMDQIAAKHIGKDAALTSIEIALESASQIACDTSDCFFSNTISWRTPTTPNPMEVHPRVVFERMFGDGGSVAQRKAQARGTISVLDSLVIEVSALTRQLGNGDRRKLQEYLDAVRDIETRIQRIESQEDGAVELPERPADIPSAYDERARLMFDLLLLAFQSDTTRVFTMLMAREASGQSFPELGVPEQHHSLSHHLNNPTLMAKKAKIDSYLVSLFSYFLQKMQATPDGDGSLLDHSLLLYGGGLGDGNLHDHSHLPCLLAGGARGHLKGARHLVYAKNTPKSNLLLTILDKLGVATPERIGDSTEHLAGV